MLYLLYLISLLSLVNGKLCSDGRFTSYYSSTDECEFYCETTQESKPLTDVTFEEIKISCSDVRYAALFYGCTMDDLIWQNTTINCECPACACSEAKSEIKSYETLIEKSCYNCTCAEPYGTTEWYYQGIFDLFYQCEAVKDTVSEPYNWNDDSCALDVYCIDSITKEKHYPGQAWWAGVGVNENCEKYCYCDGNANIECETGFADIVSSDNEALTTSFLHDNWHLDACSSAPENMYAKDTGPYCEYTDVRCSCGEHEVGDVWYVASVNYNDRMQCNRCSCKVQSNDEKEATCSYAWIVENESGSCGDASNLKCHIDLNGGHSQVKPVKNNSTAAVLNSEVCPLKMPETYCSWELNDGANTGNRYTWKWNCDNSWICGIYGINNDCIYGEATFNYTGCFGETVEKTIVTYLYCCNSENCNHRDIDILQCTKSEAWSAIYSAQMQCNYEFYDYLECQDYALEQQTVTCDSIEKLYEKQAACYCPIDQNIYNEAPSSPDWKGWMLDNMDTWYGEEYGKWNDALNCDIQISCDLEADHASTKHFCLVSAIFSFVMLMTFFV